MTARGNSCAFHNINYLRAKFSITLQLLSQPSSFHCSLSLHAHSNLKQSGTIIYFSLYIWKTDLMFALALGLIWHFWGWTTCVCGIPAKLNWENVHTNQKLLPAPLHSFQTDNRKVHVKLLLANVQPQLPLTSLYSSERHTLKPFCNNRCGQSCLREIGGTDFGEVGGEEHGGGHKWVKFLLFSYNLWVFMEKKIMHT